MNDNTDVDGARLLDVLMETLLGEPVSLTRLDIARRTGVAPKVVAARWRTLGFPDIADDTVAFTKGDLESLRAAEKLVGWSTIDQATQDAFIRTVGRTFSRLAEWQARAMLQTMIQQGSDPQARRNTRRLDEMLKLGAVIQENLWRRHLAGAVARLALQETPAAESEQACAGFVDIVGFTGRSRVMTGRELAALVDHFESVVSDLVTEHNGRVVKTIGDEILFVTDDPVEAAWLGVGLINQRTHDPAFPNVRVGIAYGDVFNRLGDVIGPVVNMASRLTSAAPRGSALIDPHMAEQVNGTSGLRLRRLRRIKVKGFDPVEPWTLKQAKEARTNGLRGAFEDLLQDASEEIALRLPR